MMVNKIINKVYGLDKIDIVNSTLKMKNENTSNVIKLRDSTTGSCCIEDIKDSIKRVESISQQLTFSYPSDNNINNFTLPDLKYSLIWDSLPDIHLLIDIKFTILECNKSTELFLNTTKDKIVNSKIYKFFNILEEEPLGKQQKIHIDNDEIVYYPYCKYKYNDIDFEIKTIYLNNNIFLKIYNKLNNKEL